MHVDLYTKVVLTVIMLLLAVLVSESFTVTEEKSAPKEQAVAWWLHAREKPMPRWSQPHH